MTAAEEDFGGICNHTYRHIGTVYSFADECNPGGSARNRYLEDQFTCEKCLDTKYINKRINGTQFSASIQGAVPK